MQVVPLGISLIGTEMKMESFQETRWIHRRSFVTGDFISISNHISTHFYALRMLLFFVQVINFAEDFKYLYLSPEEVDNM